MKDLVYCSFIDCDSTVHARGFCAKHYYTDKLLRLSTIECSSIDCTNMCKYTDFCGKCYYVKRLEDSTKDRCSVIDCDKVVRAIGLCLNHYELNRKNGAPIIVRNMFKTTLEHYNFYVDRPVEDNSCWGWRGPDRNGYGIMTGVYVHRFSYELYIGAIPDGMHVLHTCDNPPCSNPKHLFLGTHADNMQDRKNKGRYVGNVGAKNNSAKLTEIEVIDIRKEYTGIRGNIASLARKYNVSGDTISKIVNNISWTNV